MSRLQSRSLFPNKSPVLEIHQYVLVAPWQHRMPQKCLCVRNEFLYSLLGQCTDSTVVKSLAWPVCVAYSKPVGAFPPDIS